MKNYIASVFLFLCCLAVAAQEQPVSPAPISTRFPSRWAIKLAPLSIIDLVDPTLQAGVEYMITPDLSIQQEVGFLQVQNWLTDNDTYPRSILRLRTELRHYISAHKNAPYVAVEGLFKRVSQTKDATVDRGSYREIVAYKQIRNVTGLHIKLGLQFSISSNQRLLMDVYTGVGARSIVAHTTNQANVPPTLVYSSNWLDIPASGNVRYTLPSMALGFKIGYWIGS